MKRVKVKITKCVASPNLNGLIIDDMSVDLISSKKPRMTIEDLAKIVADGFKSVNARIDNIENRMTNIENRVVVLESK